MDGQGMRCSVTDQVLPGVALSRKVAVPTVHESGAESGPESAAPASLWSSALLWQLAQAMIPAAKAIEREMNGLMTLMVDLNQ
jgi:hypothetical protein